MFNSNDGLQETRKIITQEQINNYAKVSGDFNPIHIDKDFASSTAFGGTIAHGLMTLAFMSEMMTNNFGKGWVEGGSLDIRFTSPVKPGDTVTCGGVVREIKNDRGKEIALCSVWCKNQKEKPVISGEARANL